jgi:hypothetical protein
VGVQFRDIGGEDGELSSFRRRDPMPIYIFRGRFTIEAVKGMKAKPENREEAVATTAAEAAATFEAVGRADQELPERRSLISSPDRCSPDARYSAPSAAPSGRI